MIGATKAHRDLVSTVVRSLVTGLMVGCLAFLNTAAAEPLIATKQGFVRGLEAESVDIFLGIPYAAPPVGDLRWKPPQPHASWSGILSATKFGSHCAQTVGKERRACSRNGSGRKDPTQSLSNSRILAGGS